MKTKKLATELTNDELLKFLNKTDENSSSEEIIKAARNLVFNDKIHTFISKYNIKPGDHKILSKHLFTLFKQEYPEYKLAYFTRRIKNILPSDKARHDTVVFIDKSVLDISESIEKLLFKAKTHKSSIAKQRNYKRHIEAFLKFFKIQPGQNAIVFTIMADLYDRWTYKDKKKKLPPNMFSKILQMYLPSEHYNNERYFHINNDIFKVVSKRQLETIKKNAKKETIQDNS